MNCVRSFRLRRSVLFVARMEMVKRDHRIIFEKWKKKRKKKTLFYLSHGPVCMWTNERKQLKNLDAHDWRKITLASMWREYGTDMTVCVCVCVFIELIYSFRATQKTHAWRRQENELDSFFFSGDLSADRRPLTAVNKMRFCCRSRYENCETYLSTQLDIMFIWSII